MYLKDKVILVTGSSEGIGKATAIALAKQKAKVIVTYNKSKKQGQETLKECKKYSDCILIQLDVTNESSIKKCVEEVIEKFGAIHILVNNSGIYIEKRFIEQNNKEIRNQIEVNLIGLMNITKTVLPYMQGQNLGIVINIASMTGKRIKWPEMAPYAASKFGVRGFTKGLAKEYEDTNIKLYSINPGMTATRMSNFEGIHPSKVADIIVKVAEERLNKKSGEDIDIEKHVQ